MGDESESDVPLLCLGPTDEGELLRDSTKPCGSKDFAEGPAEDEWGGVADFWCWIGLSQVDFASSSDSVAESAVTFGAGGSISGDGDLVID
jgi:hypothetical protein